MTQIILYNPTEMKEPKIPHIPFGLLAVGSALKAAGYLVKIIDGRIEENPLTLIEEALNDNTLCVGMTCFSGPPIFDVLKTMKFIKDKKDIPIILGGYHPSLCTEQTIANSMVDIVVRGQGEETMVELVNAIKENKPLDNVQGISYKNNGNIKHNGNREFQDIGNFPRLDYGLLNIRNYLKVDVAENTLDYIASRGCPHRCKYCAITTMYGKQYFMLPVEQILDDLEQLVRDHNINGIHFLDDNFFVNKRKVQEICNGIIERNIKLKFWGMCRIDYFSKFSEELLLLLKKANFTIFNFGAESGSQEILDAIHKDIKVEQIIKTARLCKEYGFKPQFSFMIGFPNQNRSQINLTLDLIDDIYKINREVSLRIFLYTPFPGTSLYQESIEHGFTPPNTLEEWCKYRYDSMITPWTESERDLFEAIPNIAMFAFSSMALSNINSLVKRVMYRILRKNARFRFKHRLFKFSYEWRLVAMYLDWKGKTSKTIKKKI